MHIEYLREYIELAQCLNFTEAARRSCITQSALSKHLVSIEKEFGTELVARDRHSVELTQAGHALLQEALAICERWDDARRLVNKAAAIPMLRIGGLLQNPRVLWIVSSVLSSNDQGSVSITCTYNQTFSKPFIDLLRDKEVDLVFTYQDEDQEKKIGDEFVRTPIFDDPFVVVVDATHPLASQKNIHMEDLAEKTLVRLSGPYYSWGWEHIEAVCTRHGFQPKQRSVFTQPGLDYSLVDLQNDALLLSQSALTGQFFARTETHRCIPVSDEDAHFSICAVRRKDDPNAALKLFMSRIAKLSL